MTVTTDPAGLIAAVTYNGSTTAPSAVGSYPVTATVSDANYQGSASGTLIITYAADLGLANTVSAGPVKPGASLTYTLKLSNRRPHTAQNIRLVDTLDANATFASYKASKGWSCSAIAGVVTCTGVSLASGSSVSIAITVTVKQTTAVGALLSNSAAV